MSLHQCREHWRGTPTNSLISDNAAINLASESEKMVYDNLASAQHGSDSTWGMVPGHLGDPVHPSGILASPRVQSEAY